MMKRNAISLISLIITIIVLIILTGTVILTLIGNNNTIDKASEAVKKSDYTTLVESYKLKYGEQQLEALGDKEKINEIETLQKAV